MLNLGKILVICIFVAYSTFSISQSLLRVVNSVDSNWIEFKEGQRIDPVSFFQTYRSELRLGTEDKMIITDEKSDEIGFTHHRFQQEYKGITVIGGEYSIHSKNGIAQTANGRIINNLSIDVTPMINTQYAIQKSLEEVKKIEAEKFGTQTDKIELMLDSLYPIKSELIISSLPSQKKETSFFRLMYRVRVKLLMPSDFTYYVYVDAITGATLETIPGVFYSSPGTVTTLYNGGPHAIQAKWTGSITKYKLIDDTRGDGIKTRRCRGGLNQYVNDDDNNWDDNYKKQIHASTHWAAETVWDFYVNTFGRSGPDGNGMGLDIVTDLYSTDDCPGNSTPAYSDPLEINLKGPVSEECNPRISLNTVGHEFTHGVLYKDAGWKSGAIWPWNEAYALMEGSCDIFGEMVEFYFQGWVDWKYDDQSWINKSCEITLSPPVLDGKSSLEYGDANWNNESDGHYRGGVLRYWFYLLSVGGNGTNHLGNNFCIAGIDISIAAQILYKTINNGYFNSNSTFADARNNTIQVAKNWFGSNSNEVAEVTNAWYAVGVGNKYSGKVYLNNHTTTGNEQISYDCEIQTENLQVPANTSLSIVSSQKITIKSTSKALTGSYFHAYIAPVCQP